MSNKNNDEIILEKQNSGTAAKECSSPFPDMATSSPAYRYFNQPIEQIPGWDPSNSQMLFHGAGQGLVWQTVPECTELIECISVQNTSSGKEIAIEERRIRPLQDLGKLDFDKCPHIQLVPLDVVTCIELNSGALSIERRKIYVLATEAPDTGCPDIPLAACPESGGGTGY